jgi:hypothetical protein
MTELQILSASELKVLKNPPEFNSVNSVCQVRKF